MPLSSTHTEIANSIHELGISLVQAGRIRDAAFQFRKALVIMPDLTDAHLCLGHCLHLQGNYEDAVAVYDHLLQISHDLVAAWSNQGNSLMELCRFEEAASCYAHALEKAPGLHDVRVALATCYQALGKLDEAMVACNQVLATAPEHAEAHWNRALLLLLSGEYREGWCEYEWRWQKRNFTSPPRNFPQPLWRGEAINGRTVLVHAEQGFGDTLQFCRFVPLFANLGARVIFECPAPLVSLMANLSDDLLVVQMGEPLPAFDLHVPLLSLAGVFNTTVDGIPGVVPYLHPPVDRLTFGQDLISNDDNLRVGLCWAGKTYPDPLRSCPEGLLAPLADIAGISWYSLQTGWDKPLPLPITDLTSHIRDFSDTAALIYQLDLVITIDTAVAHLAGALGKPTWVMLPYAPDWRWMMGRDDSPWYPTMRLFRQNQAGDWGDVIERMGEALEGFVLWGSCSLR
jgi:hypothetical protein